MIHKITQNTWNFWTVNLIMRAKKLLSSRQIFRYAVPARTVTKKARSQNRVRVVYFKSTTAPDFNHSVSSEQHHQTCKLRAWLGCINEDARAVSKSVSCCLNSLRQIRSIQRSVSRQVRLSVVTSLVWTTKVPPSLLRLVDFSVSAQCSRTAGAAVRTMTTSLTIYTGREWLSVLNAAARLVCHSQNYDHIPHNLHWLWVPDWIKSCQAVLVFWCHSNITSIKRPALDCRISHSQTTNKLVVPWRSVTVPSALWQTASGTTLHQQLPMSHRCLSSRHT